MVFGYSASLEEEVLGETVGAGGRGEEAGPRIFQEGVIVLFIETKGMIDYDGF